MFIRSKDDVTKVGFSCIKTLVYKLGFKPWDINLGQFTPSLSNELDDSLNSSFSWLLDLITYSSWATIQHSNQLYGSVGNVVNYNLHTHIHKEHKKTIASSFVNRMQREETILLKTSDGSIEVSCMCIHMKIVWIFEKQLNESLNYHKLG